MIAAAAVQQALGAEKVPEAKRRVIAAVMLVHGCSFEEASAGLEAAVQDRLSDSPGSICWTGTFCLGNWVMGAVMQIELARSRQQTGRILRMVPRGAK